MERATGLSKQWGAGPQRRMGVHLVKRWMRRGGKGPLGSPQTAQMRDPPLAAGVGGETQQTKKLIAGGGTRPTVYLHHHTHHR